MKTLTQQKVELCMYGYIISNQIFSVENSYYLQAIKKIVPYNDYCRTTSGPTFTW